jgi:phenylalanyl-tRNA synthetase beta chain
LTREIDLVEDVARIHGYDKIPGDVTVPLGLSSKSLRDRVIGSVCDVLTAAGCYEAVTLSFVSHDQWELFAPRGDRAPLRVDHSSRRHENVLRQSLVPSLLVCRRENERQGNFHADLFEIARVFLDAQPGQPEAEVEPTTISLASGRSFAELKGLLDAIVWSVNHAARVTVEASDVAQFVPGRGCRVLIDGKPWGWLGELDRSLTDRLDLRDAVTVFEVDLTLLESIADLVPAAALLPQFPSVERDLNFVLDEAVTWAELERVVRAAAGPLLETVGFGGQYRGKQIDAGKKSYVVTLSYRSADRTLTSDEIDQAQKAVVAACEKQLQAVLR